MFAIVATKELKDGSKGFRFNLFSVKGLVRVRKYKNRGLCIEQGKCMKMVHMGRVTIYVENKVNKRSPRKIRHFAG